MAANKERLDVALVRRGLAPSRERARAMIMAGQVYVGERLVDKPGTLVPLDAECRLVQAPAELKYASRGGLKLKRLWIPLNWTRRAVSRLTLERQPAGLLTAYCSAAQNASTRLMSGTANLPGRCATTRAWW